jgi:hypothetical protein
MGDLSAEVKGVDDQHILPVTKVTKYFGAMGAPVLAGRRKRLAIVLIFFELRVWAGWTYRLILRAARRAFHEA